MAHWKDGKARWVCPMCGCQIVRQQPPECCPACGYGRGQTAPAWSMLMSYEKEAPCSKP